MARKRTKAHNRAISRSMRGKNVAPKSLEHKAAIHASRLFTRGTVEWETSRQRYIERNLLAQELVG